jgi:chemotaxis response regulator CheB
MRVKNQMPSERSPEQTKQPQEIEAKTPADPENRDSGVAIVGIGATAAGLDALKLFITVQATKRFWISRWISEYSYGIDFGD